MNPRDGREEQDGTDAGEKLSLLMLVGAHVYITFRDRTCLYATVVRPLRGGVVLVHPWGRTNYRRVTVAAIRYASVARVTSYAKQREIREAQRRGLSPRVQSRGDLAAARKYEP